MLYERDERAKHRFTKMMFDCIPGWTTPEYLCGSDRGRLSWAIWISELSQGHEFAARGESIPSSRRWGGVENCIEHAVTMQRWLGRGTLLNRGREEIHELCHCNKQEMLS